MNALARTPQLAQIEAEIDEAELQGRAAWEELARLVALVHGQELWRQATIPIGEGTSVRRPCASFVEWWVECREQSKSRAYQLLSAHAFSTIVDNEAQARELAGLSEPDARRIVEKATEGGTRETTAEELRQMRAADAIEDRQQSKTRAKRQLKELQESDLERKLAKGLRKLCATAAQHSGLPDWFVAALEKCRDYCDEQERATAA